MNDASQCPAVGPPPGRAEAILVAHGAASIGRGPTTRLIGVMPQLAREIRLGIVCLGEGADLAVAAAAAHVPFRVARIRGAGWRIRNSEEVAAECVAIAQEMDASIIVLQYECWDLLAPLHSLSTEHRISFAVMMHAMPFVNAPARPSRFYITAAAKRLARLDSSSALFTLRNFPHSRRLLESLEIIAPNRAVREYFSRYVPEVKPHLLDPAYSLDQRAVRPAPESSQRPFDLAFMGKLSREKGILRLPRILENVATQLDRTVSCVVVGDFSDSSTERAFFRQTSRRCDRVKLRMTGWLDGSAKYDALASARVFAYPALDTDTFCIAMLEALACGLRPVCFDAPYVQDTYQGLVCVVQSGRGAKERFATAVAGVLREASSNPAPADSLDPYRSWALVASREAKLYRQLSADRRRRPVGP